MLLHKTNLSTETIVGGTFSNLAFFLTFEFSIWIRAFFVFGHMNFIAASCKVQCQVVLWGHIPAYTQRTGTDRSRTYGTPHEVWLPEVDGMSPTMASWGRFWPS